MVKQNFSEECEAAINKQINMELYASYVYMSLAHHYERDDQAFYGFAKFFHSSSDEEREHAQKLMKYQNKRGGRIVLQPIAAPPSQNWGSPEEGLKIAFDLEKQVNESLLQLHKLSGHHSDPHLSDFLESEYLTEQVDSIKQLADMLTRLRRVGRGVGEHLFDKELQS